MILLSRDQTEDAATAWAEKVNMPWPTLMMEDTDNKFLEPYAGAVLGKILVLVFIILFIQKRPKGLFPQKGRAAE